MRILVVEDDPISQRILTSYLTKWGYDYAVTTNGDDAWEMLQRQDFPVVISDWTMPGLSGVELARRIRAWSCPHGQIYVILLTGKTSKEDVVVAMEAGADDFLSKPFDRDELRVRLNEGVKMVQWDRTVQVQASEIVSQLECARAILEAGAERGPEGALQSLEASRAALNAAYQAARRLDRTIQAGDVTPPNGDAGRA